MSEFHCFYQIQTKLYSSPCICSQEVNHESDYEGFSPHPEHSPINQGQLFAPLVRGLPGGESFAPLDNRDVLGAIGGGSSDEEEMGKRKKMDAKDLFGEGSSSEDSDKGEESETSTQT